MATVDGINGVVDRASRLRAEGDEFRYYLTKLSAEDRRKIDDDAEYRGVGFIQVLPDGSVSRVNPVSVRAAAEKVGKILCWVRDL